MRRIDLTQTGVGASAVSPMNLNTSPFNIGFAAVVTGTANYTVQHTFDDVNLQTFNPSTATWFNHPTIAGLSANADGNYAFPVTAIRLLVNSGGGTVRLTLLQAGIQ
jgi:hypothetical protein